MRARHIAGTVDAARLLVGSGQEDEVAIEGETAPHQRRLRASSGVACPGEGALRRSFGRHKRGTAVRRYGNPPSVDALAGQQRHVGFGEGPLVAGWIGSANSDRVREDPGGLLARGKFLPFEGKRTHSA